MLRAAGEVKANQEFVVLQVLRGDTEGALEVALGRRVSVAAQQGMAREVLGAPDVQPAQHLAVIDDPVLAIVIRPGNPLGTDPARGRVLRVAQPLRG